MTTRGHCTRLCFQRLKRLRDVAARRTARFTPRALSISRGCRPTRPHGPATPAWARTANSNSGPDAAPPTIRLPPPPPPAPLLLPFVLDVLGPRRALPCTAPAGDMPLTGGSVNDKLHPQHPPQPLAPRGTGPRDPPNIPLPSSAEQGDTGLGGTQPRAGPHGSSFALSPNCHTTESRWARQWQEARAGGTSTWPAPPL